MIITSFTIIPPLRTFFKESVLLFSLLFVANFVVGQEPGAPMGLSISNETDTSFVLNWEDDSQATMGFNIFLVQGSSGDVYITTVEAGSTSFEYAGEYGGIVISAGMTYTAKIQALPDANFDAYAETTFVLDGQFTEPSAPTGLTISDETDTGFRLNWDDDPLAVSGYNIFLVEGASGDVYIQTVEAGTTSFDYSGTYGSITLTTGGTYTAKIQALPDANFDAYAETTFVLNGQFTEPAAPTGLTISDETDNSFTLSWDDDPLAVNGFNIFLVEGASGDVYIETIAAGSTSYDYSGSYGGITLMQGGNYIAKIQALPDNDFNAYADIAFTLNGESAEPEAPTGLAVTNITGDGFTLNWDNNPAAVGGYNLFIVELSPDPTGDIYVASVDAGTTGFDFSGTYGSITIEPGERYLAKIQALPDGDGNAYSEIEVDNVVSTNNLIDQPFKVYPNPASTIISVEGEDIASIAKLQLFSTHGQLLRESEGTSLNIENIQSDLYILVIEDKKGNIFYQKIMKAGR